MPRRETVVDSRAFGSVRVIYRELGSGPPLLLVHGLMTSGYSFRYVIEPLAETYRVIVPDLVGAGDSDKPNARYGPQALAQFLIDLVDGLGITGCRAVGNSLGGYLCLRAALARSDLFSRLVDVHSPGIVEFRLRALSAGLALPGVRHGLSWFIRRDPQRWVHRNVHYYDETLKSLEEAREYGRPLSSPEGARAFVRYLSDTLAPGAMSAFVDQLRARRDAGQSFPMPLMLLYSRRDPMVPPRIGTALSRLIPSAELRWLDDTSHFAHVDTPEAFVEATREFLAGSSPDLSSSQS